MSLMGYTEKDVETMMRSIIVAKECVNVKSVTPNQSPKLIKDGLELALDLLEGLLVEGRV